MGEFPKKNCHCSAQWTRTAQGMGGASPLTNGLNNCEIFSQIHFNQGMISDIQLPGLPGKTNIFTEQTPIQ